MDIFSTTVIVIHEIYTVSVFIRRVVHDIHGYEATVSSIQARLEHEFLFLDTFKQQFFDPNDGNLRKFKSLPDNLARNVNSILTGLNKCLVEYRVVALKHGVDLTEAAELLEPETNATSIISPSTAPVTNEDRARRFRDKVRALAATLRQKSLAPEWALFSMSKVETLVNEYPQWTKRLRQLMFLMLLIDGRVGSLSLHGLAVRDAGSALGLKKVAARQIRAKSNSPVDLGPLDGTLEIRELTGQSGNLEDQFAKRQVGVYTDAFGAVSVEVLLEKHLFDLFSADPNEDEKARIRSSIARDLVWTLRDGDPSAPEYSNGLLDKDLAGLLPCLGYLPADDDGYHSLAYRLPSGIAGKPLLTLHDHILGFPRPPLGDRFALAWRLTATVLDILSSGWVHKNIWSRGVLIMLSNDSCPTPYLVGWTSARPNTDQLARLSGDDNLGL
ncbi:hypothetical protein BJX66DRAFT_339772 [Aspergillus keveii]|uniref:Prion-inhibition and propagation HeLo domain-containing protein n=1 Tax=Aspergillus keveii TaxID=714993 RepID=A0ABR4G0C6_9EURO